MTKLTLENKVAGILKVLPIGESLISCKHLYICEYILADGIVFKIDFNAHFT